MTPKERSDLRKFLGSMTKAERRDRKKRTKQDARDEVAFRNGYTNIDPLDGGIYNGYVEERLERERIKNEGKGTP